MRAVISSGFLVLAVAGCGDRERSEASREPVRARPVALDCDDHVEPPRPPDMPLQGVVFRSGAAVLTIDPAGPPSEIEVEGHTYWLWKAPVGLTADTRVDLRFGSSAGGRFFHGYRPTKASDLATQVVITSCKADTPLDSGTGEVGRETGFAFAFLTQEPSCSGLELTARIRGRAQTLPLGRGRACAR